jgi:hypothetical protein
MLCQTWLAGQQVAARVLEVLQTACDGERLCAGVLVLGGKMEGTAIQQLHLAVLEPAIRAHCATGNDLAPGL